MSRRLIPPETKTDATIYREITYKDVFVFLIFLVLSAFAISSNLGWFKVALAILLLAGGFASCIKWGHNHKGYEWLAIIWRYIFSKKKYSDKALKDLINFKNENGVVKMYGIYAKVIEVSPIEFLLYKQSKQEQIINQFASTLRYIKSGSIVKIERPIDYSAYIERYKNRVKELEKERQEYVASLQGNLENVDEIEFISRMKILKKNIEFLEYTNTKDKINAEVYYVVLYENSEKTLENTVNDTKTKLTNIGLQPKVLNSEEINEFLNLFIYKDKVGKEVVYPKVTVKGSHIKINNVKWNFATIGKYPVFAEGNSWASGLCTIPNTNVIINFKSAEKESVIKGVNKAIKELRFRYLSEKSPSGQQELQIQVEGLLALLQQFSLGNESIHDVNVYVMYKDSEAIKVRQAFTGEGFVLNTLAFRQFEAFVSSLPVVGKEMLPKYRRNIQDDTLSASFPFVNNLFMDKLGDYLGDFRYPVFWDMWERGKNRVNSNLCVLGQSGGGKTFCQKKILMQQRLRGTRIFVLDCENEYRYMTEKLGGQAIEMAGGSRINPFQIFTNAMGDEEATLDGEVSAQCSFLSEWFKSLFVMDIDTKSALDNLITDLYASVNITDRTDLTQLKDTDYPTFDTMKELIDKKLENKKTSEYDVQLYRKLANYISLFVGNGIYARFWNGRTELDITNDFTVFDFQRLFANANTEVCNAQMQLLMRLLMQETIKVKNHNEMTGDKVRVIILVDEAHRYISPKFPIALDTLEQFARRIRKYDGALIVATQNIDDFVGTSEEMRSKASAVINNCQYSMLFGLKADDINKVQDLYANYGGGLTIEEVDFLARAELGQMLFLAEPEKRTIVQVGLMPDEKQYIVRS